MGRWSFKILICCYREKTFPFSICLMDRHPLFPVLSEELYHQIHPVPPLPFSAIKRGNFRHLPSPGFFFPSSPLKRIVTFRRSPLTFLATQAGEWIYEAHPFNTRFPLTLSLPLLPPPPYTFPFFTSTSADGEENPRRNCCKRGFIKLATSEREQAASLNFRNRIRRNCEVWTVEGIFFCPRGVVSERRGE